VVGGRVLAGVAGGLAELACHPRHVPARDSRHSRKVWLVTSITVCVLAYPGAAWSLTRSGSLLLHSGDEYSLTELAQRFHAPLSTVHGEVKRLTDAGLLRRREVGRSAMVRANPDNRLTQPLAELLLLSWGPLQVVAEEFSGPASQDSLATGRVSSREETGDPGQVTRSRM
jgi:DNA-binding transcriptional ArsR family regulator